MGTPAHHLEPQPISFTAWLHSLTPPLYPPPVVHSCLAIISFPLVRPLTHNAHNYSQLLKIRRARSPGCGHSQVQNVKLSYYEQRDRASTSYVDYILCLPKKKKRGANGTIQRLKYLALLISLQLHAQRPNLKRLNRLQPTPTFSPRVLLLYRQLPLAHRLLRFRTLPVLHRHHALLRLLLMGKGIVGVQ